MDSKEQTLVGQQGAQGAQGAQGQNITPSSSSGAFRLNDAALADIRRIRQETDEGKKVTSCIEEVPYESSLLFEQLSYAKRTQLPNLQLLIQLHGDLFDAALDFEEGFFKVYVGLKTSLQTMINTLLFQHADISGIEELRKWELDQKFTNLKTGSEILYKKVPQFRTFIRTQDIVGLMLCLLDKLVVAGIVDAFTIKSFRTATKNVKPKSLAALFKRVTKMVNIVEDIGMLRSLMSKGIELYGLNMMLFATATQSDPIKFDPRNFANDVEVCKAFITEVFKQSSQRTADKLKAGDPKLLSHILEIATDLQVKYKEIVSNPEFMKQLEALRDRQRELGQDTSALDEELNQLSLQDQQPAA